MDLNITATVTQVDKDTQDVSIAGTLSDPVIAPPPALTADDLGLVIGNNYSFRAAASVYTTAGQLLKVSAIGALILPTGSAHPSFVPWYSCFTVDPQ